MLTSFAPLVSTDPARPAKVLILGTMPSVKSLQQQQYYGHPQNAFWPIMTALFAWPQMDYEERVERLPKEGVALWDVVASCIRPGSADADIQDETANDIAGLLTANPSIRHIFFNGGAAQTLFRRHLGASLDTVPQLGSTGCAHQRLPSTSPAYASMRFEQKLEAWREVLTALQR